MMCPHCRATDAMVRKGSFLRKTGLKERIRRFYCRRCRRNSSEQTGTLSEGHRRPDLNRLVYLFLCSGVSQRRIARLLGTTQTTVARKLVRLSKFAQIAHAKRLAAMKDSVDRAVFDEMETFEHSKCKPVAIAVAVDEAKRYLLAATAAKMPAKGRLAAISRKKYGRRPDHRRAALVRALLAIACVRKEKITVKSDLCPRYPTLVAKYLPGAIHRASKGRRACVVGLGELKAGGFDPLFSLNHTCAMTRDNIKRLSRRTWCTTKRIDRLQCLLDLYICAHNSMIDAKLKVPAPQGADLFFLTAA